MQTTRRTFDTSLTLTLDGSVSSTRPARVRADVTPLADGDIEVANIEVEIPARARQDTLDDSMTLPMPLAGWLLSVDLHAWVCQQVRNAGMARREEVHW
jgi:hypothetical protein